MRVLPIGLFLGLLAAVAAASCAAEPECASDNDCDSLSTCVDGTCQKLDLAPDDTPDCVDDSDCSAGETCRDGVCSPATELDDCAGHGDPTCLAGTVCTIAADSRCTADGCRATLACEPNVGETLSLHACAADAECQSGACIDGSCLRTCSDVGACPGAGFVCGLVSVPGRGEVRACLAVDRDSQLDPEVTLCNADAECREGRVCKLRSPPGSDYTEVSVCEPPLAGLKDNGASCYEDTECQSGFCPTACAPSGGITARVCRQRGLCTNPCVTSADCVEGRICSEFRNENDHDDGSQNRWCRLPLEGCFDDVDCCPERDPVEGCVGGWTAAEAVCTYRDVDGHALAKCELPVDPALNKLTGEPCETAADCASGLCLPAHAAYVPPAPEPTPDPWPPPTPEGGWKVCTSACDPLFDRCGSTRYAGSTCRDYTWELGGRTLTLPVCQ